MEGVSFIPWCLIPSHAVRFYSFLCLYAIVYVGMWLCVEPYSIFSYVVIFWTGEGIEEASEEAQCTQALDARQARWSLCKLMHFACVL